MTTNLPTGFEAALFVVPAATALVVAAYAWSANWRAARRWARFTRARLSAETAKLDRRTRPA